MQYEIKGGSFPVVECQLGNGESMVTESGSMIWMSPNIAMDTSGGGLGKMFSKAFSGESLFQNIYRANGDGFIAFGSSFPGCIVPIEVGPGREFVLQKRAFLASEQGVDLSIFFNQKLSSGVFSGEGFIMQKVSGHGICFAEVDGDLERKTLGPGEQLIVDTGNVAGFDASVKMEIRMVKGLKNKFLGGEGLFNTVLTGPGEVWLQTMPLSFLAQALQPFLDANKN